MGDGGAALAAEPTPNDVTRRTLGAAVLLYGAVDGELVFGDDGDEGCTLLKSDWGETANWWV